MTVRLFFQVFSIEARKLMSYRADFWITAVVSFIAQLGVAWFLWDAIFSVSKGKTIGGYGFDAMVLYYVLVTLVTRLVRAQQLETDISQDIYDGALSRYLVFPTDYVGFKYAQFLGNAVPSVVQLVLFLGLYALVLPMPDDVTVTATSIVMACASVAVANLLFYSLTVPFQLVAFWADNVWSLGVMLRFVTAFLGGAMIPLDLFPEWSQRILDFLPFKYLFYFPVVTALGKVTPAEWGQGLLVSLSWCLITVGVSKLVWRRGMLVYTGVGI